MRVRPRYKGWRDREQDQARCNVGPFPPYLSPDLLPPPTQPQRKNSTTSTLALDVVRKVSRYTGIPIGPPPSLTAVTGEGVGVPARSAGGGGYSMPGTGRPGTIQMRKCGVAGAAKEGNGDNYKSAAPQPAQTSELHSCGAPRGHRGHCALRGGGGLQWKAEAMHVLTKPNQAKHPPPCCHLTVHTSRHATPHHLMPSPAKCSVNCPKMAPGAPAQKKSENQRRRRRGMGKCITPAVPPAPGRHRSSVADSGGRLIFWSERFRSILPLGRGRVSFTGGGAGPGAGQGAHSDYYFLGPCIRGAHSDYYFLGFWSPVPGTWAWARRWCGTVVWYGSVVCVVC
eukprot:gene12106-biopygen6425